MLAAFAAASSCAGASAACQAPAAAQPGYFASIQPSDGVLDVWCRLQSQLDKGKYDVKLVMLADKRSFLDKDLRAERTFKVAFDRNAPLPREELASMLQSLIPTDPYAKATDEQGQPFPAALERTVQGVSPATPDGQPLGIPRRFSQSRTLALWVTLQIKVRPLKVMGKDFYLTVTFKPSVGRLLMATTGKAEQLVLRAATEKVVRKFAGCPEHVPDCKLYDKPTVDIQTAWIVDKVGLASEGLGGLSGETKALAESLVAKRRNDVALNTMNTFSIPDGSANVQIKDDLAEFELIAEGDPQRASGTRSLRMLWQERQGGEKTYGAGLAAWTKQVRDQMVLNQGPLQEQR